MGRLQLNRSAALRIAVISGLALSAAACADNAEAPDDNNTPSVMAPGQTPGMTQTPGGSQNPTSPVPNVPGGMAGSGAVQPGGSGTPTASNLPCNVNTVVQTRCQTCHAAQPIGGAPMPLVTYEDFHKDHVSKTTMPGVTKKVFEWVKIRVNDAAKPMPQGRMLPAAELATVNAWLDKQAPQAGSGDACQTGTSGENGMTGMAGTGGMMNPTGGPGQPGEKSRCDGAAAYEPLVARDGETCYDFPVHGQTGTSDTSKFTVHTDESYNQFYYAIPWKPGSMATRFGANFDNKQVLHHWLAFSASSGQPAGTVSKDVTGTTLGEGTQLIGGWAVGGCNVEFPQEMGLKLPDTGGIMIQWHHYNYTGMPQMDGSKVQMCTLPAGARPNLGGLTWLGSENIDVPAGAKGETFGTCVNDSNAPITIIAFWPHMHEMGINMKSEVQKSGQSNWTTVFDKPFDFNYQVHYTQDPYLVLQPGDSIRSTCTYMNTTSGTINFGQSTKAEMCYQFAFSYPAGALDNGVVSLIGASNTCWQFGE